MLIICFLYTDLYSICIWTIKVYLILVTTGEKAITHDNYNTANKNTEVAWMTLSVCNQLTETVK